MIILPSLDSPKRSDDQIIGEVDVIWIFNKIREERAAKNE